MDIIYSRRGQKADDVIKQIAERSGEELMVVTSDRDIVSFIERRGGTALASLDFEALVARRSRERSAEAMARTEGKIEEKETSGLTGTRKKGPARRLSRRERDYQKRVEKL